MITSVALLDHEMVARQPEWRRVIELEVWLQLWQSFLCDRLPANDERQISEPDWSVQMALQPRILGSEIRIIDECSSRLTISVRPVPKCPTASSFIVDNTIVSLAQPLTESADQFASSPR